MDVRKSTETVYYAAGHYAALRREYVQDRFGTEMMVQKLLIKRPFEVKNLQQFHAWQEAEGISAYPEKFRPRMSTFLLLSLGHDGMRILEDDPGTPQSESWLAFHPKQVVTIL